MKLRVSFFLLVFGLCQCKPKQDNSFLQFPGKPVMPASIKAEHESLLYQIRTFAQFPDSTGIVAKKLQELMEHHFSEEENYVLPQLGLLDGLTRAELPQESDEIIKLTEQFKSQRQHISAEHQMIKAHLNELSNAAEYNSHDIKSFLLEVEKHAALEEEILFPASILVGDYLAIKSQLKKELEKNH